MEPISFALALGSIPSIFTSCVECYRYIQFGREFEKDFEMSFCKLEAAEMRLTRWGTSIGIEGPETKLRGDQYNEKEIKMAYHWLKEIKKAFDSAMERSSRYRTSAKSEKLNLLDTDLELHKGSDALQALHYNMRRLNDERVKPRKRDRISWALYRKGNFEDLVENISELTNDLVDLFPSTIDAQKKLCKNEIEGVDIVSLALLDKAIGDEDGILKPVLQAEAEQRPNFFTHIEVWDHFRGHFGDNVAQGEKSRSGIYSHINAGGNSMAHFGSNIGNFHGEDFDFP